MIMIGTQSSATHIATCVCTGGEDAREENHQCPRCTILLLLLLLLLSMLQPQQLTLSVALVGPPLHADGAGTDSGSCPTLMVALWTDTKFALPSRYSLNFRKRHPQGRSIRPSMNIFTHSGSKVRPSARPPSPPSRTPALPDKTLFITEVSRRRSPILHHHRHILNLQQESKDYLKHTTDIHPGWCSLVGMLSNSLSSSASRGIKWIAISIQHHSPLPLHHR